MNHRSAFLLATVLSLAFAAGCGDLSTSNPIDDSVEPLSRAKHHRVRQPPGLVVVESNRSFDDTFQTLVDALEANPNIGVVATLDHAANAARVGLELPPTREVFFGNPNLGTPLMQRRQTTGIDLPQKILVWEDDGRVFVGYNSTKYLQWRHWLSRVSEQLQTIAAALRNFAGLAADAEVDDRVRRVLPWGFRFNGLVFVRSAFSADETFTRLRTAIDAAPPLNELFALEHDQNAARVGLELRPTKLVVFGNPNLGTPLMQSKRTIGIDLPQKFLVFENRRGDVYVAYNDPFYIAKRHRVRDRNAQLETIATALANLAKGAASP